VTTVSFSEGIGVVRQEIWEGKRNVILELEKFEKGDGK
jgi:hypothetical protein